MPISPENEAPKVSFPGPPSLPVADRARLIYAITELYAYGRDNFVTAAEQLSDLVAGYHTMDMVEPDLLKDYLEVVL